MNKIVLLDFCSEKNRGDAAMQVGLIQLVQKHFPSASISVVSVFGSNQSHDLGKEYDHTLNTDVELLGGLKPTFYPLQKDIKRSELTIELLNATSFLFSVFLLFILAIKLPRSLVLSLLPRSYHTTLKHIWEADLVIWNGRNFRSRNNALLEIYRMYNLVFHPLICIMLSKKMVCVGASVWRLKSPVTRNLLHFVFKRCFFISVREPRSYDAIYELMQEKESQRIQLLPDLSFAVLPEGREHELQKTESTDFPKNVGITLVDWKSDGSSIREKYKETIVECINHFIQNGSKISLIPQVTKKWENFEEIYDEVLKTIPDDQKENITIIPGEPFVNELLEIYSKLDFLLATRMHSAIFAAPVGTPLVAIAYDKGGKWGILEKLGLSEFIVPYSEVTQEALLAKINQSWRERERLVPVIRNNVIKHIEDVELHMSMIKTFLE